MAKVTSEKKYISFVKGLITEANALTFPENASLDEDNFDLKTNGSRVRRLGVDYEDGYILTDTGISAAILEGTKKSFHKWDFPGGATDISVGVVRAYNKLWFVNLLAASPSASLLNGGAAVTIAGLADSDIETVVINNLFVLVSKDLPLPVILTYDKTLDVVSQEECPLQVRDIWGVADDLEINERPVTLSDAHDYNLRNQGWSTQIDTVSFAYPIWAAGTSYVVGDIVYYGGAYYRCVIAHTPEISYSTPPFYFYLEAGAWTVDTSIVLIPIITPTRARVLLSGIWSFITQQIRKLSAAVAGTKNSIGVYPSNTDIWTLGKIGATTNLNFEKYDPVYLKRNSIDNTEAPKGSFILDAFKRGASRLLLTGIPTLPTDEELGRVSTVTAFSGRVCYAGIVSSISSGDEKSPNYSGTVFFSQTVTGKDKVGKCYQEADPTSSTISDIIETDGGTIQFPEISSICKLVAAKDSLLVFAENGIWEIYGDTGGFKATAFQIAKVSSTGTTNAKSIVLASGNIVVYWAKAGIIALVPNPTTGRYIAENLSLTTIQSFYVNTLSDIAKKQARGFFDEKENHIRWLYNGSTGYTETSNVNHYNRQLNLDLTLQAFYKFSISPLATNSPSVVDFVDIPSHAVTPNNVDVYSGSDAVLSVADQVIVPLSSEIARTEKYSFLVFRGTSFTLGQYKDTSFMDWKTADTVGINYSSYLITGYEVFGDIMRTKMSPYIFCYLTRTEDGFTTSGSELIADNQSSCLVQAQWNWTNSATSNKWGTQFQAYRYLRAYVPTGPSDTYDTGDSIIVTKNKLRGSGKALSLKIQSEQGKDMKLLGWGVIVNGDGTP